MLIIFVISNILIELFELYLIGPGPPDMGNRGRTERPRPRVIKSDLIDLILQIYRFRFRFRFNRFNIIGLGSDLIYLLNLICSE